MAEERTIDIEVLRYRPGDDSEPVAETFEVPFSYDTSVLQGIQYIKDHLDGSLAFRWSCRMAICGSCGMMLNGQPNWMRENTCRRRNKKRNTISSAPASIVCSATPPARSTG